MFTEALSLLSIIELLITLTVISCSIDQLSVVNLILGNEITDIPAFK